MDLIIVGLTLPWLVVALACWIGHQLVRQNGRILLRLERLEEPLRQPARPSRALAVGSTAPAFELPDLDGQRVKLEQFRGKRVLLIFFSPTCGFCQQMAPALAALPTHAGGELPLPLVVSTGDPHHNRELVAEHGIRCPVVLQDAMEVASAYGADGTPMGYLLDEHGVIESEIAVGAEAVLGLATRREEIAAEAAAPNGQARRFGTRGLANSRLERSGLAAGTTAPGFRLLRLDGDGELGPQDYRGHRLLLVFSDPACGPCNELAPRLQDLHRQMPWLGVLMVSRGDPAANRAKRAEHGLTFPIVLQRHWEISRRYAMFATPIAYLIDEQGGIAADVAVGSDAILALTARSGADGSLPATRQRKGKAVGLLTVAS